MENSRKIKLLKLWELLKNNTDEKNPMSTNEIIKRLGEDGIEVDRKILYSDIDTLNSYGFEVMKTREKSNKYYVEDRSFDASEIKMLIDAVQAIGSITESKTETLIDKIAVLAGSKRGEALKSNVTKFSTVKSKNDGIYYSIDKVISAKENGTKISFNYFDYDTSFEKKYRMDKNDPSKKKLYVVNPVATVFDGGYYYLICYDDKHMDLSNYRIDRMDRVSVLEDKITPNKAVEKIDIAEHKRQLFGMFSGKPERVRFEISDDLVGTVCDAFGDRVRMSRLKTGRVECAVEVQAERMFIAWCCSFGNRLKVKYPASVVEKVKEHIRKTAEQYE